MLGTLHFICLGHSMLQTFHFSCLSSFMLETFVLYAWENSGPNFKSLYCFVIKLYSYLDSPPGGRGV